MLLFHKNVVTLDPCYSDCVCGRKSTFVTWSIGISLGITTKENKYGVDNPLQRVDFFWKGKLGFVFLYLVSVSAFCPGTLQMQVEVLTLAVSCLIQRLLLVFFTVESSLSLTDNSRVEFVVQDIQLTSGSIFPKSLEILTVEKNLLTQG